MNIILVAQAVVAACVAAIVLTYVRQYLAQRHLSVIPGPVSPSFATGNLKQIYNTGATQFHQELYRLYGRVIRLAGPLGETQLMISDTKALYTMLIKDQNTFEEAGQLIMTNLLVFGPGLLSTLGSTHKKQRKLLNPAFSTNHMRRLVPMFQSITMELQNIMRKELAVKGTQEIDMLDWMGKLALELIAQAGLGYTFKALEGENSDFGQALKSFIPLASRTQIWRRWLPHLNSVFPARLLRFTATHVPWPDVQSLVQVADTIYSTSKSAWEEKKEAAARGEEAVVNQLGGGKDIMSIILRANSSADEEDKLPDDQLLAQMGTFLFAGTDTTSSALSRILHLLSLNPDVQEKLRQEVTAAGGEKGELDHDALNELPILEAICRETLRLFPPLGFVQRLTLKDAVLPLGTPVKGLDGRDISEIMVPSGTFIHLNIAGVNRDPEIWGPDADQWKPERWLRPLPESVAASHIPGVYANQMTFIGGGRACIGFKFSLLEMKVVLSQLLPVFRFAPPKKEIFWRFGVITTPSVVGSTSPKPYLPLTVSLV
ncbi:cytochrome P450 [Amylostereum chailletii]|nr:cytochrome P450 [Amylostereum chailletii]